MKNTPRHFRPRNKSGQETLLVLNFWTHPVVRHFWPLSFWILLAPKFLDKSGPETSPSCHKTLLALKVLDTSAPKTFGQVRP